MPQIPTDLWDLGKPSLCNNEFGSILGETESGYDGSDPSADGHRSVQVIPSHGANMLKHAISDKVVNVAGARGPFHRRNIVGYASVS